MNVSLTPELEKFVKDKVATGRYASSSEVVREALRILEENEHIYERRLEQLKREVALGIEQADQGKLKPGKEVIDRLLRKNRKTRRFLKKSDEAILPVRPSGNRS